MTDILRGLVSAGTSFLLGWVLPLASASVIFVYVILVPSQSELGHSIIETQPAILALLFGLLTFAGGLIMNAMSTGLYRILEGYLWPRKMQSWGRRRQADRKRALELLLEQSEGSLNKALVFEKLDRFPIATDQLAPTALGNAMRSFETFGVDRYRLDSQSFWVELTNVVPADLRADLGRARAAVDFFVALVFIASGFAICCGLLTVSIRTFEPRAVIGAATSLALVPIFYRAGVSSTTYWHSAVRAMVNIGRKGLAEHLGLQLPATLEQERQMWEAVAALNFYPFDPEWSNVLDEFRLKPGAISSQEAPARLAESSDRQRPRWYPGRRSM